MCFALQGRRSEMDRRKTRREIRQSMMDPDDDEPIFGPRGSMDRRNDPIFGNTKQDDARPNLSVLAAMLKPVIDLDEGDNLLGYKMPDEDTPTKNVAAAAEAEMRLEKKPCFKSRPSMEDSDDNDPIYRAIKQDDAKPHSGEEKCKKKRQGREKALPKPTRLDKALAQIEAGASDVNLIHLGLEPGMDSKLASLIDYVKTHPHVVSVELQAIDVSF